jgi:kynureninase
MTGATRPRVSTADDPDTIYLDGNSLGRLPLATRERLHELIEVWGSELVGGWQEWIDLPTKVGDLIAEGVVGAGAGEVIACDSTTVNLLKLASAVLSRREGAVVTVAGGGTDDWIRSCSRRDAGKHRWPPESVASHGNEPVANRHTAAAMDDER